MAKGDIAGAKKFCTDKMLKEITQYEGNKDMMQMVQLMMAGLKGVDMEVKIDGDKSTVSFNVAGDQQSYNLVKQGGDWKIDS